ncbi:MAG: tRNA pseudouridine(54/55) synthase Pus10 [Candidatus Diapherotrites archaeon]|nr:tRNA pseudouridine(54/55) synthase Pus10 [Candidatus Diapherotrites archaeon]
MDFDYSAARKHLLEIGACDRCIGRQFHRLFEGMDQGAIGSKVRQSNSLAEARHCETDKVALKKDCPLCSGYFLETDAMAKKAAELLAGLDYENFLVGCRVDRALLGREEELWVEIGALHCEPLKKDLVRQIGLELGKATGKEAEFTHPDVTALADFTTGKVSLNIHALFVYGKYKKLLRGIPQTKWFCRRCRGRGCKECNFTGKMYEESVEEIIAKPFMEKTGAKGEKFHGSGREDIDATCLGWRPFVLELQQPLRRFLDWEEMAKEVNSSATGKIEVQKLRKSSKEEVRRIKAARHDKTYEAIIECENDASDEAIESVINEFQEKEISQRTPDRVSHRRADLVRKRAIHGVELEKKGLRLRAVIRAEAGAYIKELISGDSGRTKPSFADFLGPCKCVELNVLEVHDNV